VGVDNFWKRLRELLPLIFAFAYDNIRYVSGTQNNIIKISQGITKRWRGVRASIKISYFRGSVDFTVCRRRQHAITTRGRIVSQVGTTHF